MPNAARKVCRIGGFFLSFPEAKIAIFTRGQQVQWLPRSRDLSGSEPRSDTSGADYSVAPASGLVAASMAGRVAPRRRRGLDKGDGPGHHRGPWAIIVGHGPSPRSGDAA